MTTRTVTTIVCAAALVALAPRAASGSAADAFENKVKPVSGQSYTKSGKLELTPEFQLSMDDAFFSKYMVGLRLGYHLNEYFSFAVGGVYAISNSATGSTMICTSGSAGCTSATASALYQVPGYINWIASGEVAFSPIYGKLNVFAEKALHFDLSIAVGADLVSYRDVISATDAEDGKVPSDATSPGGHLAIGTRLFLSRSTALTFEVKDVVYAVSGLSNGYLQNQLFAQVGLSFFVPVVDRDAP